MCLLHSGYIGFLHKEIADLLSMINTLCCDAVAAAMYYASQDKSATTFCFCDTQDTMLVPRKKATLVVLF
jgi:hypothetical protein